MSSSDKGGDEPLVELVHGFQIHIVGQPHILIHQVQSCMSDELVQVTMVILFKMEAKCNKDEMHKNIYTSVHMCAHSATEKSSRTAEVCDDKLFIDMVTWNMI